MILSLLWSENC